MPPEKQSGKLSADMMVKEDEEEEDEEEEEEEEEEEDGCKMPRCGGKKR